MYSNGPSGIRPFRLLTLIKEEKMKFMTFVWFETAKAAEMAQVGDKIADTPGRKVLAQYLCQGIPFPPAVPPNSMLVISINDTETNEAMAAATYPAGLAGAIVYSVPVLEMPVGGTVETEKEYRG